MDQFQPQLSLYQNVDAIYFAQNAELRDYHNDNYFRSEKNIYSAEIISEVVLNDLFEAKY